MPSRRISPSRAYKSAKRRPKPGTNVSVIKAKILRRLHDYAIGLPVPDQKTGML
jgi:hypothetical protein